MNFYNHDRFYSALGYDKPMNVYLRGVEKSAQAVKQRLEYKFSENCLDFWWQYKDQ